MNINLCISELLYQPAHPQSQISAFFVHDIQYLLILFAGKTDPHQIANVQAILGLSLSAYGIRAFFMCCASFIILIV